MVTTVPDAERRACVDCGHLRGAVSWWCASSVAAARRRTRIPGHERCPDWTPALRLADLPWWRRWIARWLSDAYVVLP